MIWIIVVVTSLMFFSMNNLDSSPLLIAGPSGVGKTYIADRLLSEYDAFEWLLSTSNRPRRPTDQVGRDYDLVREEEYRAIAASGDFFMDEIFGRHYGYRRSQIESILARGKVPLALVYTPVVDQFIAQNPGTHALFLEPVDLDLLKKRMINRGEDAATVTKRMAGIVDELDAFKRHRALFADVIQVKDNTAAQEVIERVAARYQLNTALR
jgi:guanylate kinase